MGSQSRTGRQEHQESRKLFYSTVFPRARTSIRDLIRAQADRSHVIAPDYQGFGNSDAPDPGADTYSFDGEISVGEGFRSIRFVRP
jgi:hypothetical protein